MNPSFDLVVVGTGEAGSTAAPRCRAAGWHVAIIDSRPYRGTCGLRGCDPKKILVGAAAEILDWLRRMTGKGIQDACTTIVRPELIRFKGTFTDPMSKAREDNFQRAGRLTCEQHLIYSDQFMELEHLPKRIAFVGDGYIAFEFSHVAAHAGS